MKKTVFKFGIVAGLIVAAMLFGTTYKGEIDYDSGELLGFATMILAFSSIFFGIRSYRDKQLGGMITFGSAFQIGLFITLIASTIYVITWMIIISTYGTDFMDQYTQYAIQKLQESGESVEEIKVKTDEMRGFQEMYKNPLIKIGFTYMEILPIGLAVSLICAAILKKK